MSAARVDADSIYDRLRADITSGELAAGTPLREVALATRFGVSRTPVREALRRLQHDRMLVPGTRGLQVRTVDPHEVVQVYDIRILLEAQAAREAARARTTADLAMLEGLLARDRALVDPPDQLRARTNVEFHAAVWVATHNPVLQDLLEHLTIHLVRTPHSTLSAPGRWAEALDEHERLLRAVGEGDADGAAEVAAAHMGRARQIRLSLLRTAAARPDAPGT
ncbi:GntR family transcriptional regulator [Phycicoccus sp. CSK15P-2]|uniref:GntR family transcriptional regulator n=1 Tax=Phycicoccus sp. CSK15P-2 TaxID=2807627 RepID=UPI00194ED0BA|nr:GntR family transcriptional regulator [Phycicoccus sp. CSK15P-2]MBM6404637.1 GntR family transcriptional regulator [Phycicoccus sp. CSK15P-2]